MNVGHSYVQSECWLISLLVCRTSISAVSLGHEQAWFLGTRSWRKPGWLHRMEAWWQVSKPSRFILSQYEVTSWHLSNSSYSSSIISWKLPPHPMHRFVICELKNLHNHFAVLFPSPFIFHVWLKLQPNYNHLSSCYYLFRFRYLGTAQRQARYDNFLVTVFSYNMDLGIYSKCPRHHHHVIICSYLDILEQRKGKRGMTIEGLHEREAYEPISLQFFELLGIHWSLACRLIKSPWFFFHKRGNKASNTFLKEHKVSACQISVDSKQLEKSQRNTYIRLPFTEPFNFLVCFPKMCTLAYAVIVITIIMLLFVHI